MISSIYEHSIDLDLLTPGGWVMDFGCGVDFNFSKKMLELGMNVIGIDPNPKIVNVPDGIIYERMALVSDESINNVVLDIYNDTDAASIIKTINDVGFVSKTGSISVEATTINKLMLKYNIDKLDVLKLDIEGGEYSVLLNLEPISKQISIEFHDFRGMNPYYPNNEEYYNSLRSHLVSYDFVKHQIEQHRGIYGPQGLNYWDSLLILKD